MMKKADNLAEILAPYTKDRFWVVLSEDRTKVVGKGKRLNDALKEAKKNKVKNPIVIKAIPDYSNFILTDA